MCMGCGEGVCACVLGGGVLGQSLPSTPKGREEIVPTRDDGGESTGSTVLGTTHAVPRHGAHGWGGGGEGRCMVYNVLGVWGV